MRPKAMTAMLFALVVSTETAADTWQTRGVLIEDRSSKSCDKVLEPSTLDFAENKLSLTNRFGKMFTVTVPVDGTVKHQYKSPSGARLEISGNAKTRELKLLNTGNHCWWSLDPI